MIKKVFATIALFLILITAPFSLAQAQEPDYGDTNQTGLICPRSAGGKTDFIQCIPRLYNFALAVSGIIAMGTLIAAGYLYMTAGGDGDQLGTAKEMVGAVAAGIVLLATAYILLKFLDPNLLKLTNPNYDIPQNAPIVTPPPAQAPPPGAQPPGTQPNPPGTNPTPTPVDRNHPQASITALRIGNESMDYTPGRTYNARVGQSIQVTVSATDDSGQSMTICFHHGDNACAGPYTIQNNGTRSHSWNTSGRPAGATYLGGKVTDRSGKETSLQSVSIILRD